MVPPYWVRMGDRGGRAHGRGDRPLGLEHDPVARAQRRPYGGRRGGRWGGRGFVGHERHTVALPFVTNADLPDPGPAGDGLPIKMLTDRILVKLEGAEGERRSSGGILIPATAQMGKRLVWAKVVAVGPNVRSMEAGDQVFQPETAGRGCGDDYVTLAHGRAAARRLTRGHRAYPDGAADAFRRRRRW
jgi:chaperonin GroES